MKKILICLIMIGSLFMFLDKPKVQAEEAVVEQPITDFQGLDIKNSLSISYNTETLEISKLSLRFQVQMDKELYEQLIALDENIYFGSYYYVGQKQDFEIKDNLENVIHVEDQIQPRPVNADGIELEESEDAANAEYFQYATLFNGFSSETMLTNINAVLYVEINGTKYFVSEESHDCAEIAQKYLSETPNDEAVITHKDILAKISEILVDTQALQRDDINMQFIFSNNDEETIKNYYYKFYQGNEPDKYTKVAPNAVLKYPTDAGTYTLKMYSVTTEEDYTKVITQDYTVLDAPTYNEEVNKVENNKFQFSSNYEVTFNDTLVQDGAIDSSDGGGLVVIKNTSDDEYTLPNQFELYLVQNEEDLNNSIPYRDSYILLTNDIELDTYKNFKGYGTELLKDKNNAPYEKTPFTGTFDGDGFAISGLEFAGGFFGSIIANTNDQVVVKDVAFKGSATIKSTYYGVLGFHFISGIMKNVLLDVDVKYSGGAHSGAFFGEVKESAIIQTSINSGSLLSSNVSGGWKKGYGAVAGAWNSDRNLSSVFYLNDESVLNSYKYTVTKGGLEQFGKTQTEFLSSATYALFDKSIWLIQDGQIPTLRNDSYGQEFLVINNVEGIYVKADETLQMDVSASGDVTYSLKYTVDGVNIDATTGLITFTNEVVHESEATVVVTLNGSILSAEFSFVIEHYINVADYEVNKELKAVNNEYQLEVESSQNVTYSIPTAVAGVAIDSETGLITMDKEVVVHNAEFTVEIKIANGSLTKEYTFKVLNDDFAQTNTFYVSTKEDLLLVANDKTGKYLTSTIILRNNIEFDITEEKNFPGIQGFIGTFDGAGYEISGLNFAGNFLGKNLGKALLEDEDTSNDEGHIIMENIKISGKMTGTGYIAGIATNCYAKIVIQNVIMNLDITYSGGKATGAFCTNENNTNTQNNPIDVKIKDSINIGSTSGFTVGKSNYEYSFGAVIGRKGVVENVYWISGRGFNFANSQSNIEGAIRITDATARYKNTYSGLSSDIWYIEDGYLPMLKNADFVEPTPITSKITITNPDTDNDPQTNIKIDPDGTYQITYTVSDDLTYENVRFELVGSTQGITITNTGLIKCNGTSTAKNIQYFGVRVISTDNNKVMDSIALQIKK